mgnify:CR=1 FL=1|tara:strand:+ start:80 stop:445 length:366 start_codon:yes stop_codon:yes gene_type:complete
MNNMTPVPTSIKVRNREKVLEIDFEDGKSYQLPAELLRVESPSAEVQGHSAKEKKLVSQRKHVGFLGAENVGNYAIRIRFDDFHDTGIYSWAYLRHLGENQTEIWNNYLKNLSAAGLSRNP